MLAYVFWHRPEPGIDRAAYENALASFHRSLSPGEVDGFCGSSAYVVSGASWLPGDGDEVYEDWYLVDDWTALGRLNDAAVSGRRLLPHDDVAALSSAGTAGLYRLRQGQGSLPGVGRETWFAKPASTTYQGLFEHLGNLLPTASVWQRQLTLGPPLEMCAQAPPEAASKPAADLHFGPAPTGSSRDPAPAGSLHDVALEGSLWREAMTVQRRRVVVPAAR